jgi:hypothetical protein
VAITILPVVGLWLISFVTKKRHFIGVGMIIAFLFALIFIVIPQSVTGSFCGGNYVIFSAPAALYEFYGGYYFAFLIFAIWESLESMREQKNKKLRQILKWFILGYLSFMVPMGVVYAIYEPARIAVASIMCGFAVILAFIIAFQIVPKYYDYKKSKA